MGRLCTVLSAGYEGSCTFSALRFAVRSLSNDLSGTKKTDLRIHNLPPKNVKHDLVSPPDPESKLRRVVFYVPKNETHLERRFRLMREDTQNWNHKHWSRMNKNFYKEKELYVSAKKKEFLRTPGRTDDVTVTQDDLAAFYREFLLKNHETNMAYNREWYKRNFTNVWMSFRVAIHKMTRKRK